MIERVPASSRARSAARGPGRGPGRRGTAAGAALAAVLVAALTSAAPAWASDAPTGRDEPAASAAPASATPATTAAVSVPDGTFVEDAGTVYRIAGGAPIVVPSWDGFGAAQPTVAIDDAELAALPTVPADGTVIMGVQRGEAYVVAGGAPIYVSSWVALGAPRPAVQVDDRAIDHAGDPGPFSHLRAVPANETLIRSGAGGPSFVVVSGHVAGTEAQGSAVAVDPAAITNAGTGGVWDHLRMVPVWSTAPLPAPVPVATTTPSPSPSSSPTSAPVVGTPATTPPAVLTPPARTGPQALSVTVRRLGHRVGHGWLCLSTSRTSPVRHHATSAGGCVRVAAAGPTTITPRQRGDYLLVLIGRYRHVSHRVTVTGTVHPPIRWTL